MQTFLCVAGEMFLPTCEGALWWESERTLIVSDLHFEKGSSYARRGQLLPPYDTGATLGLLEALAQRYRPDRIISLGDSFHDAASEARLSAGDRDRIRALTASVEWYWVEGNHDPDPPADLGGHGVKSLVLKSCIFRHEPTGVPGEIAGHLHPVARIGGRGRTVRRKCFVTDGSRLIMPSMGTFTGGLNILHPAVSDIFGGEPMVIAAGADSVHLVERRLLVQERESRDRYNWHL